MPFPDPHTNVPRQHVATVVDALLADPDVVDVSCHQQDDGTYLVVPHPTRIACAPT